MAERIVPEIHRSIELSKYQNSFGIILLITLYSRVYIKKQIFQPLVSGRVLKMLHNSLHENAVWKLFNSPSLQFNFLVWKFTGSSLIFTGFHAGAWKYGTSPKHIEQFVYTWGPIRIQQNRCLVCSPAGCSLPIVNPPAYFTGVKTTQNESKHLGFWLSFFVIRSFCCKVCLQLRLNSARELSVSLHPC